jgi:hypothetical protein
MAFQESKELNNICKHKLSLSQTASRLKLDLASLAAIIVLKPEEDLF